MQDADGVPSQNYFVFFTVYLTGDASLRDKLAVSFFGCFFTALLYSLLIPQKPCGYWVCKWFVLWQTVLAF